MSYLSNHDAAAAAIRDLYAMRPFRPAECDVPSVLESLSPRERAKILTVANGSCKDPRTAQVVRQICYDLEILGLPFDERMQRLHVFASEVLS